MSEIRTSGITTIITGCHDAIFTVGASIAKTGFSLAASHASILESAHHAQRSIPHLHTRQHPACAHLSHCLVRQQAAPTLHHHVHQILAAPDQRMLEQVTHELEAFVHDEQTAIIHDLIAPKVAAATATTGFHNVHVLPHPDKVLVIGENDRGQALQHELVVSLQKPLTLRSETLGFHDHSCGTVLDQFTEELQRHGISTTPESAASTLQRTMQARHHVMRRIS